VNREELIQKAIALGRTPEDAAKIADAWIARQDESKGEKKTAPKAAPATKAPPKPPAAKTPEPPKPSPVVAAQVPKVGTKTYGAEPPPTPMYESALPDSPLRLPTRRDEPEIDIMGRGGLWLDREAAAKAQAKDRAREAASAPTAPSVMRYAAEEDVRDYSNGGGWQFTAPREVQAMREALRKVPRLAEGLDDASDEDVRAVYEEEIVKARR